MRKHCLRILAILFLVCFGAALFSACDIKTGGNDAPKTYTVTASGLPANITVQFEKEGPYESGAVVRFDVLIASGADLRLTAVKADGAELQADGENKYSVTVREKDIVITVETEPTGNHDPLPQTYTVTATGEHATVTFETEGPYAADTVVYFTVTAESGFALVSVKNGAEVLSEQNGKYAVTVSGNIVITVETREIVVPPEKKLTEFADANLLPLDGENFQLILRAKATGYASADELKGDVRLLIGGAELGADEVTLAGDIFALSFPIGIAKVNVGESAEVKLRSVVANITYPSPATRVNERENAVQFDRDVFTLTLSDGKLSLAHTVVEPVAKEISFAGTTFEVDGEGKIYLTINMQSVQGYTEEEILAAKLKVGSLEFAARADVSGKTLLRYDLTGGTPSIETLTAEKYAVVLSVGSETYPCPTVANGQVGLQARGGKTFTLTAEGENVQRALFLTVAGRATTSSPIEGVWKGEIEGADGVVTISKGKGYIDLVVLLSLAGEESAYALRLPENQDGGYGASGMGEAFLDAQGRLVLVPGLETVILTEHSATLDSVILPAGERYSSDDGHTASFGSDRPTEWDGMEVLYTAVGKYIVGYPTGDDSLGLPENYNFSVVVLEVQTRDTILAYYEDSSVILKRDAANASGTASAQAIGAMRTAAFPLRKSDRSKAAETVGPFTVDRGGRMRNAGVTAFAPIVI